MVWVLWAPWFSKSDVFGVHLSGESLESWGAWRGVRTLCSSGRSSGFASSLPIVSHPERSEVWQDLFRPLLPSSVFPIWRSSLTSSQVFIKGNCPIYICGFAVLMGGSEFMIFLCLLLRPHPLDIFFNISETHRSSTETTTEIKASNILSLFSLSQGNVVPRASQ